MKIRFESDDDLPLGKTFNILDILIDISIFILKMFYKNTRISYKNVIVRMN